MVPISRAQYFDFFFFFFQYFFSQYFANVTGKQEFQWKCLVLLCHHYVVHILRSGDIMESSLCRSLPINVHVRAAVRVALQILQVVAVAAGEDGEVVAARHFRDGRPGT